MVSSQDFLSVVKVVFLISEFIYGLFAFLVLRQVSLMNKTFQTSLGSFFTLLAYVHFFAVVAVFILTLVIL